jgi:hypothetical protein
MRSIVIIGIVIVATRSTTSACATSATSFDEPTLAIALAAHSATTFGCSAFHCSFGSSFGHWFYFISIFVLIPVPLSSCNKSLAAYGMLVL